MVMIIKFCEKKDWQETQESEGGIFTTGKPSVWKGFATVTYNEQVFIIDLLVEGRTITQVLELPEGLSRRDLQNLYDDFLKTPKPQTYIIEAEKKNHDSLSLFDEAGKEVDSQTTNSVLPKQTLKQHGFFSNPLNVMTAFGAVVGIVGAVFLAFGASQMSIALMLSGFLTALVSGILELLVRSMQEMPSLNFA